MHALNDVTVVCNLLVSLSSPVHCWFYVAMKLTNTAIYYFDIVMVAVLSDV